MAEYITKEAAINAVENAPIELFQSEWEEIEEAINAAPAADVVPVVQGGGMQTKIAQCAERIQRKDWTQRSGTIGSLTTAPNCGAKMDGGADNG